MPDTTLKLTDPIHVPKERHNALERLALRYIGDERDLPFIRLSLLISATVIPAAIALFLFDFSWWFVIPYYILVLGIFLGPYILMLHNVSHRKLFKPKYRWMDFYIVWILGPFFGETPNSYYVHHIGMHHPTNNLEEDLSCTMFYQRDSVRGFARYLGRFYVMGVAELARYMWQRRRFKLFRQLMIGEGVYYLVLIGLLILDWRATLVVFIAPLIFARFAMMAGNWAQHAFIDHDDPGNSYRNSITCINSLYNRRCFNDGYHIGHHVKATRHWTDMPGDFLASRERYAREGALVFEGLDFFVIWFLLMTKRYDKLASHVVQLGEEKMSHEEIVRLLRERTRRFEGIRRGVTSPPRHTTRPRRVEKAVTT